LGCVRSEFQGRKDEVRNRNLEELTTLKNNMEENMDNLWFQLQTNIKNYRQVASRFPFLLID
jgi:hypothetical protein